MSYKGDIKTIRWGLIPNLPTFNISVGQTVAGRENLLVLQIQQEYNEESEVVEFHIECKKVSPVARPNEDRLPDGPPFIWKTYTKMPDEIQYYIPEGSHNHVKI